MNTHAHSTADPKDDAAAMVGHSFSKRISEPITSQGCAPS